MTFAVPPTNHDVAAPEIHVAALVQRLALVCITQEFLGSPWTIIAPLANAGVLVVALVKLALARTNSLMPTCLVGKSAVERESLTAPGQVVTE